MINYLYTRDYSIINAATYKTRQPKSSRKSIPEKSDLVVHAEVYALAGKYDISELKRLAASKYLETLPPKYSDSAFVDSLRVVLEEIPDSDLSLRGHALQFVGKHYRQLVEDTISLAVFKENKDFAVDILQAIAHAPVWSGMEHPSCPNCELDEDVRTRSKKERRTYSTAFECESCGEIFD